MTRVQALRLAKASRLKKLKNAGIWVHHSRSINLLDCVPDNPRSHPQFAPDVPKSPPVGALSEDYNFGKFEPTESAVARIRREENARVDDRDPAAVRAWAKKLSESLKAKLGWFI